MAILKNLLVNGASRFLGHVYMQDLDVAGTTNFGTLAATNITASGTLAVTGATTLSSTLSVSGTATFAKTTDLSGTANNSPALIVGGTASQAHIEIDANEIQSKGSGTTTADLYINNDGGKVNLGKSGLVNVEYNSTTNTSTLTTPVLSATDGSIANAVISNARVTNELIVDGVLETNEMRTNIIKAVGGQLYVAPTFVATNSTTIVCTAVTASTVSFTITDSTAINSLTYGGANWNSGSKLKFTAKITSNNIATNPPVITFSSAEGVLTSNMNATSGKLTFTVDYDGASTYFKVAASTNLTYSDMSVMMYQIKSGNDYFPVGIYIKSYGTDNKNSYIDVYGGTTAFPNARLGLLNGLKDPDDPTADLTINGTTVSGWGLMSSYAYLKGRIVSKSGTIGGWDIGANTLTSGTLGVDNSMWLTTANVPTATKFAGADTALSNWRFGIGSKFGVLNDGTMYCSNAIISGNITATEGNIGGCNIANGVLKVPAANITGTVTATQIDASGLTIGQSQVTNLTTDLGNKASSSDLTTLSNKVTAVYGTCNTTASTAAKGVKCSNFDELFNGALITVKFTTANTSSAKITLNVNSKGAKDVWVANAVTSASNQLLWGANAVITFRYDGTQFVVVGEPRNWYGASTTAASTAAKTDTTAVTGCVVCKGTIVSLSMTNDNTATSPTLNIQSTGAKALYAGLGTTTRPLTSNGLGWTAGSTTEFIFDGQYWRVGDTASLARAYAAQTTATNAAKTATNYITTVTNAGIKVHDANNDSDYVQITSDGTYIYKGSSQMASFGTDILLGQESGTNRNIFIDADSGVNIKKGSTVLANYGDTITINHGTSGKKALTLDSTNGLQMYALNGTTVAAQLNASGLIVNTGIFGGSSGFTITTNKLYSNGKSSATSTNNGIYVQSGSGGGIYLGAYDSTSQTCPFQVTADGVLEARNANISGDITATSGKIGGSSGFTIATNKLYSNDKSLSTSTNEGIYIQSGSGGGIYLGAYDSETQACPFQVTIDGVLTSRSGTIGGWHVLDGCLYSQSDNKTVVLQTSRKSVNLIDNNDNTYTLETSYDGNVLVHFSYVGDLAGYNIEFSTTYSNGDLEASGGGESANGGDYEIIFETPAESPEEPNMDYHFSENEHTNDFHLYISFPTAVANTPYTISVDVSKNGVSVPLDSVVQGSGEIAHTSEEENLIIDGLPANAILGIKKEDNNNIAVPFYITDKGELYVENATIGANSKAHLTISNDALDMYYGNSSILHFGYGNGINSSGTTSEAPYYTIGTRQEPASLEESIIVGNYSFGAGINVTASGYCSIALGWGSTASNQASTAMGHCATASGHHSTAFGEYTIASGSYSTAMGSGTTASALDSTAMGLNTTASNQASTAMGSGTTASGYASTAMGGYTKSLGYYSTAMGRNTVATASSSTAIGKYNVATRSGSGTEADPYTYTNAGNYAFIIGNGTGDATADRSNALTVDWNGNLVLAGSLTINGNAGNVAKYETVVYQDVGYINGAFTNTGSSIDVKYSKIGNIVTASGQIHTGSNIAANAYIQIFKLPDGYGPNVQIFFTAYGNSGQRSVMWYIDHGDSGWIRLYTSNGMVANTTYTFCVSYVH